MRRIVIGLAALLVVASFTGPAFGQDTTPPTVVDIVAKDAAGNSTLLPGAALDTAPTEIVVTFSEPVDPATVSTDTFWLVGSGGDGTFADGNEVEIVLASVTPVSATEVTVDLGGTAMTDDTYEIRFVNVGAGTALSFDGNDDFVLIPSSPDLSANGFTFEAWVYRKAGTPKVIVTRWNDTTANYQFNFSVSDDAKLRFEVAPTVGIGARARGSTLIEAGTWYHVAAVADKGPKELRLYVNGARETLQSDPGWDGTIHAVDMEMQIGRNPALGRYWNGSIDEVRVWNVVRTRAEIEANMHRRVTGSEAGVVGYYRFDEGGEQIAHDSSPSGNDATLGWGAVVDSGDPTWVSSGAPIDAGIADATGNLLDGEYSGSLPSGDGSPGGDFVCTFEIRASDDGKKDDGCAAGGAGLPLALAVLLGMALVVRMRRRTAQRSGT